MCNLFLSPHVQRTGFVLATAERVHEYTFCTITVCCMYFVCRPIVRHSAAQVVSGFDITVVYQLTFALLCMCLILYNNL